MPETINAEVVENESNSLVIKGKTYILTIPPDYKDELVQEEVKKVLQQLSLKDVIENLYISVELLYVSYNGVAGAKGGTLQSEIAQIQSSLALLCNDCVETMTSFEANTKNIILELGETYRRLVKGQEKLALKKLTNCSESSNNMSKAANTLAEKFKELQIRSTKARSNTIEAEACEHDRQLAAEKAEREMLAKQNAEQQNQKALVDQIANVQQLYNEAKEREEKESTKALVIGIISAVTGAIGAGLGAFGALKNPAGSQLSNANNSTQIAEAQRVADEKKRKSDQDQHNLLAAKDEQTAKQNIIDKLKIEMEALNKNITAKEQDSTTKEEELTKLKEQRTAKQNELNTAEKELTTANNKVKTLESTAKDSTEAYAAAGTALQNLAKSTGEMSNAAATAEKAVHDEKMALLNKKLEMEKEKRQSLVALAEYSENIKNLKVEEGMAIVSVKSLHAAVESLGKIIASLTNASLFWDQMAAYCERMTSQGFQQHIKDLTDCLTLEERQQEYREPDFMKLFLSYMCQWVAVNGISGEYVIAAANAQKKAVEYLKESPTIEEALRKAPELAKNMELIISKNLSESRQISAELEQQKALISTASK